MRRFLTWLSDRLPAEEIAHQGEKFMERYYVATLLGWRVYIHRFIGSDPDGLHDHPWRFGFSLILSGWYMEQRLDRTYVRRWCNAVNGDTFHRVIVPVGGEAWTLFAHNRRYKAWGFLRQVSVSGDDELCVGFNYFRANAPVGHSDWHLTAPRGRDLRQAREVMPAVFRRRSRSDA